ncbi:hypothetical protein [Saccharopolyspora spinosa]|uniref:hypothetical protein n=1 Tax=Saccharopolyspora spinosa TaxID=60894 RepID=UPI00117A45A9|nr:hypothetical protein [Saccharopolyspora spinosa]
MTVLAKGRPEHFGRNPAGCPPQCLRGQPAPARQEPPLGGQPGTPTAKPTKPRASNPADPRKLDANQLTAARAALDAGQPIEQARCSRSPGRVR